MFPIKHCHHQKVGKNKQIYKKFNKINTTEL